MGNNWQLHHIGVVVRDMDKVVEYLQSLDIAEFQPERMVESAALPEYTIHGKTPQIPIKLRVRFAQIGPVAFELLQPIEGETLQKKFLDSQGEGVEHVAFMVDDLDKETAELVKRGLPVIHTVKTHDFRLAHFDTQKFANIKIELYHE